MSDIDDETPGDLTATSMALFVEQHTDDPWVRKFVDNCWWQVDITGRPPVAPRFVRGAPKYECRAALRRMAIELGWERR